MGCALSRVSFFIKNILFDDLNICRFGLHGVVSNDWLLLYSKSAHIRTYFFEGQAELDSYSKGT